jgi:predicted RNA-binding protein with PIN domain
MRTLIDGYNLMFAAGLMGTRFGPDGLRKARTRFLNDLASKLGPVEAHLTTVVFDVRKAPDGRPAESTHKGIRTVFAVANPTADERIDELIRAHGEPKRLTVVSSDNQVRASAKRRGATSISSDDFLDQLDRAKRRRSEPSEPAGPEKPSSLSEAEAAYWAREFGEVERSGELKQAFERDPMFPSDEEIARIAREVEREGREGR